MKARRLNLLDLEVLDRGGETFTLVLAIVGHKVSLEFLYRSPSRGEETFVYDLVHEPAALYWLMDLFRILSKPTTADQDQRYIRYTLDREPRWQPVRRTDSIHEPGISLYVHHRQNEKIPWKTRRTVYEGTVLLTWVLSGPFFPELLADEWVSKCRTLLFDEPTVIAQARANRRTLMSLYRQAVKEMSQRTKVILSEEEASKPATFSILEFSRYSRS